MSLGGFFPFPRIPSRINVDDVDSCARARRVAGDGVHRDGVQGGFGDGWACAAPYAVSHARGRDERESTRRLRLHVVFRDGDITT
jgi:hypothetical protein